MKKNNLKLNESFLNNVIKQSVKKVLNEAHVIDAQFGQSNFPGSFEAALVDAWRKASEGNKKKLENAFPEYFPMEAMYGNEKEKFDFREFPYRGAYDEFYKGWKERNI